MYMGQMTLVGAVLVLWVSETSFAQDWVEFSNQEERVTITFPDKPVVEEITWLSEFGSVLPGHEYSVTQGQSRYSLKVIDYNPVERLNVERAKYCPQGAETCMGLPDWGIGYWKNDIRGALIYATAQYLQRPGRLTSYVWNGVNLVTGQMLQFTNPDESRTFVSIYMHESRLVIVEGTTPKGSPPPTAFTQSLSWLDENGNAIRYPTMYVNYPDVPKPGRRP